MDSSSLFTKLIRYAQTSGSVATTAVKFASEQFLGISLNHEKQASLMAATLGQLKGPIMKVAQFLATVPGALPDDYARAFLTLQTNAPSMNASFVKRRMRGELGDEWQRFFEDFDLSPSYAASLGQVHQAQLMSGEKVACKLQYPDMEGIVEADLNQLKLVLSVYEAFNDSLKTEAVFSEIKEKLFEELDYMNEAKNLALYRHIFQNDKEIFVPNVYSNLSTKRLLTMDWCNGKSVLHFVEAPLEIRNHIARTLFHAWYYPLYHYGVIHGDPHPGNYQVNEDGGINLLDFGCVRVFKPDFIHGVIALYEALKTKNRDLMIHAYETWGFAHLTHEIIDVMSDWAKLLFDPLLDNRVRPIQEKIIGWDVASKIHEKLHKLGGIKPPKEFVFMDRAAVGIGSVLFHLQSELNWHLLFEELVHNFSKERIQENQIKIMR